MKWILSLVLLTALHAHAALEVYDDTCLKPTPIKHRWYFDAVAGDDTLGDGSKLKPWKSVVNVFQMVGTLAPKFNQAPYRHVVAGVWTTAADAGAPIKPGDALELMSGNYGDMRYLVNGSPDWLTIEPVLGQKPVFTSLLISGASKVYIHDVKVQSQGAGTLIALSGQGTYPTDEKGFSQYPAQDIILDRLEMSSVDDASAWLAADWVAKAKSAFSIYPFAGRCISLTNSKALNVGGGFAIGGEKVVIAHNSINYFRDDALPFFGNFLNLHHNRFTNSVTVSGIHKDFFQGQIGKRFAGTTTNHYHDIVIDSNVMLGKTDPRNTFYTGVQGINTFDEDWTNMKVTNNVVIGASCTGIGLGAVHGGEVANNIVLHDLLASTPGCYRGKLGVAGGTHESPLFSDHIRMHHNIAEYYAIDFDHNNTWDNNLCTGNSCQWVPFMNGAWNWGYGPSATDTNKSDKQFVQFSPAGLRYNVAAPAGSMADQMKAGPQ